MTDLSEQDKMLCEIADAMRKRRTVTMAECFIPQMGDRIRELSAQLAEHPNATALMAAQRKIDALQQHAEQMAEALGAYCDAFADATGTVYVEPVMRQALANWTAWLLDGKD